MMTAMTEVTRLLDQIRHGDLQAAEDFLPLVYEELRKLAAQKLAHEKPGQTIQATALVHEAYLRLIDSENAQHWNSRGHFFAAAAEAMRRILVENARRKLRVRHGGALKRQELDALSLASPQTPDELVDLSEALDRLAETNVQAAEVVKLRFFAGLTNDETAAALGISPRKATQVWAYARVWLLERLGREPG
ncbi:MAG TPA: ECF-type sigma factor [Pirellulales bacterium]|nr:ECF-type sigma factor [Pirellulales bacterium]